MTVLAKPLLVSKYAEAAQTTQYTVASGVRTILDKFTATNVTGSAATLSVNLVPSGGTAGASNTITLTKTLAAGDVYTFPEIVGHVLAGGEFVSTLAGTATAIVIRISGREIS